MVFCMQNNGAWMLCIHCIYLQLHKAHWLSWKYCAPCVLICVLHSEIRLRMLFTHALGTAPVLPVFANMVFRMLSGRLPARPAIQAFHTIFQRDFLQNQCMEHLKCLRSSRQSALWPKNTSLAPLKSVKVARCLQFGSFTSHLQCFNGFDNHQVLVK